MTNTIRYIWTKDNKNAHSIKHYCKQLLASLQASLQPINHKEKRYHQVPTRIKLLPPAADEGDAWWSRRLILSEWGEPSWRKAPGCSTASFDTDCPRGPVDDSEPVWSPAGMREAAETGAQVESALAKADDCPLSWSASLASSWWTVSDRCLTAKQNKTATKIEPRWLI